MPIISVTPDPLVEDESAKVAVTGCDDDHYYNLYALAGNGMGTFDGSAGMADAEGAFGPFTYVPTEKGPVRFELHAIRLGHDGHPRGQWDTDAASLDTECV